MISPSGNMILPGAAGVMALLGIYVPLKYPTDPDDIYVPTIVIMNCPLLRLVVLPTFESMIPQWYVPVRKYDPACCSPRHLRSSEESCWSWRHLRRSHHHYELSSTSSSYYIYVWVHDTMIRPPKEIWPCLLLLRCYGFSAPQHLHSSEESCWSWRHLRRSHHHYELSYGPTAVRRFQRRAFCSK